MVPRVGRHRDFILRRVSSRPCEVAKYKHWRGVWGTYVRRGAPNGGLAVFSAGTASHLNARISWIGRIRLYVTSPAPRVLNDNQAFTRLIIVKSVIPHASTLNLIRAYIQARWLRAPTQWRAQRPGLIVCEPKQRVGKHRTGAL